MVRLRPEVRHDFMNEIFLNGRRRLWQGLFLNSTQLAWHGIWVSFLYSFIYRPVCCMQLYLAWVSLSHSVYVGQKRSENTSLFRLHLCLICPLNTGSWYYHNRIEPKCANLFSQTTRLRRITLLPSMPAPIRRFVPLPCTLHHRIVYTTWAPRCLLLSLVGTWDLAYKPINGYAMFHYSSILVSDRPNCYLLEWKAGTTADRHMQTKIKTHRTHLVRTGA